MGSFCMTAELAQDGNCVASLTEVKAKQLVTSQTPVSPHGIATVELFPSQVELELRAQVQLFRDLTGHLPHHMDGHQHVHVLPGSVKSSLEEKAT